MAVRKKSPLEDEITDTVTKKALEEVHEMVRRRRRLVPVDFTNVRPRRPRSHWMGFEQLDPDLVSEEELVFPSRSYGDLD